MREEMGEWRVCLVFLLAIVTSTAASGCPQDSPDRNLLCYQTKFTEEELDPCLCTHWVLTRELLDEKDYLVERNEDLQIILSVETGETNLTQEIFHEGVQGIELSTLWTKTPKQLVKYVKSIVEELHQSSSDLSRSKRSYSVRENEPTTEEDDLSTVVTDSEIVKSTVNTARDTASSTETVLSLEDADNNLFGDRSARDDSDQKLMLIMRLPSNAMFLAKHYDLKGLARYVDLFVLNTDNIVETRANVTYHPSRLMGINDIHNADSLVDLITGLGIPKDKLVLAFPTHAYQFQLANASLSLPQSPALGAPKLLTQAQLCKLTKQGNWTTERDEDLTAPYTFQNNTWIAFDDEMSASIKSKYIALSNLAGAAIMDIQDQDWSHQCGGKKGQAPALVRTLYDTFTQVIRKPRQTQLLELQQQLHEHSMDAPTRVVRVVDHEGATHVVRRDVVVNFQCSRQGYFVHPTGCNRFYRCVKFNQYTDDWTVFEYDCPAGLAFDERWEVCVWPGSLPDGGACQGSSEIAPVPRNRFQCPAQPGYYADPENCRWFFACLDHAGDGVTPLTAYEFRCPFSLVFNEQTLVCDWPWNVQGCGSQGVGGARFTYGDLLEGRHKPSYATVPDYLVSGGRIENSGGTGGSILGTYYGSNGVLDINAAGGYPSESQQVYGSKSAGGRLSGSAGGLYSGDRGSTTSGSNQYGNYVKTAQTGAGGYGVFGPAGSGYIQGAGAYVADNEGAYVHGQYPGDSGDDGSYREGQYGNGGLYVSGEYGYKTGSEGAYAGSSGGRYSGSSSAGGKYSGSRVSGGQYSGSSIAGGKYSGSSVTGGSYAGSNGQYGKGEQYSGSDEAGYVSRGEYSANGPGKYFGAAAGYNQGVPSSTPYAGLSGQYDAGKYSAGSGEYVSSADQYSGGQYSGSSQYSGAKLYTGSPVVSTTATPFVSTQYSTAGLYSGAKYTGSPLPVSTTISPFLSTQAGQYTLSNGLTYSGPSVAPTFAASKSVLHHSSASVGTASTLASTTASPYSDGVVSSTTPGYSGVGGVYSGVSLSGEKFGVDGESGHIHSPFKVNNGFEQYTGGFDNIAYQVNSLQPSLSENVDGNGYSTSGKVFFSPTPTPGGFSSYTPSSYGTSTPNPFYGSSTSLPGVFSSLYPGKSYVSTTPAPVPYSSFSSAKSTTATPVVASYSTPRPVSYGGASYSTTPAPVVSYSSTPAPFSPSYSPSVASYSPSPIPYSPSVGSYSPSPAPYSPSVISYSSTPAPYAPSGIPYSPSVISYPSKSAPYSPSGSHYSPSPAPYSPSTVSYSTTPAPVVSYSSTPAPYSPSVVSYSSTPAPYPSYSPSVGSYSSGARYSPSVSSYSPTPAPYSPSVTSYSTPAPVASYSPSPSPVSFASYPSPKPVAYTPGSKVYAPSSTVAPAIVSYSTPAPKTYYPTSTPVPIVQYSSIAPPLYSGSLTGFPGHSQYTGGQAYVSGYAGPSFSQGYESQQYSGSYSAGSSEYNAGASAGKVQYGRKSPISYSTTTEKGSYASPSAAPAAYSTTVSPINTYSAGSNVYSGSDYSSGSRYQNYVQSNVGYSASQAYSGDEYLPPLESVPAYDVKKPCDHPAAPVPSAYAPAPAIPYQTFLSSGYEQVKYQTPYVFESSTPAPPDYNRQSFQFRPIVVQPLPEVSSFKDYFYSSVLPSSYSTPAPIAYSTTPAYISTVSPIQYSIPIKTYVSSTPAPPTAEYQYVSSYSTPKPFVSTTASPIYENSYVSSYSTPKPVSYTPAPVASTTSRPIVDYSFGSTYTPRPVTYAPTPYVSTTAAPIVYSTTASPVSYAATFESAKVYPTGPPSVPLSFASYSSPPVVYGPGNLQPIRTYQSTGSYDVQSYTATPKPCASNALDIADESKAAGAENLPDGTYVVGIKHQDKVVIVSRLSDFNPLLVEKLGATCDCQAQSQPIKVLRRRKILKSTTASPNELGSSGQYNSNSIETYNAHKIETASPDVDVVSYNTQAEAEKSEQFHASPKVTSKKIYSAKKSSVTSTTEKSYESSEDKHSHDDKLSITEFGTIECKRAGLFRHPKHCNKFYQCNWDEWKKKYTLHEFKCPIHLAYDSNIGACNWPSKGPACSNDNLLV